MENGCFLSKGKVFHKSMKVSLIVSLEEEEERKEEGGRRKEERGRRKEEEEEEDMKKSYEVNTTITYVTITSSRAASQTMTPQCL